MTPKHFGKVARELFAGVLSDYGFSCDESRFCTFYRQQTEEVYHFVLPDLGARGAWFDVKVFPASPLLDPLFNDQFPDDVGIPTDSFSYLSERGIGLDQEKYNCKSEDNFRRRFDLSVQPALREQAIPYLDQFQSLQDIVPVLKAPHFSWNRIASRWPYRRGHSFASTAKAKAISIGYKRSGDFHTTSLY